MMHNPLTWFVVFCLLVWGSMLIFWRNALSEISAQATEHAKTYAGAYAKGFVLVGISVLSSFIDVFEKLSPDVAQAQSWWSWLVLYSKPVVAGLITLGAYLDTSVQKAKAVAAENAEAEK